MIDTIYLKPLLIDHLSQTFLWRNDERIYKWCRQSDLLNETKHQEWFERQARDPSIKMYSIYSCDNDGNDLNGFVGVCGLTDIDLVNQRAEFSLYIGPKFHGLGYGTKALKELLKVGFNRYPLNSIWGEVFDNNPAMKIFEKIGFAKEGIRKEFYFRDGKFIDAHLISINRKEFLEKWK